MLGNIRVCIGVALSALGVALLVSGWIAPSGAREALKPAAGLLLSARETVVGEPIVYPVGMPAHVSAAVVTLAPGQETGWHTHGMPVLGYVLEGVLDVDYGAPHGVRRYEAGTAMMEAIAVSHNGRNPGPGPVRILAVFMGAEGLAASTPQSAPR